MNTFTPMQVVTVDDTTAPPLVLALQTLQTVGTQYNNGQPVPFNIVHGNTNFVNVEALSKHLQAPVPQSSHDLTSMLLLAGQMLWRYAPAILELDGNERSQYLTERRLPTKLTTGRHHSALAPMMARQPAFGVRSKRTALRQASTLSGAVGRSRRLSNMNGDYRLLGDYTVVRSKSRYFHTDSSSLKLNAAHFLNDIRFDDQERAQKRVRAVDHLYPDVALVPYTPDDPESEYAHELSDARSKTFVDVLQRAGRYSTTPLDVLSGLADATPVRTRRPVQCDAHNPFYKDGSMRNGTFFNSGLIKATLEPLNRDLFGFVDTAKRPFTIVLNSNMAYPRVEVSFAHEMLHVLSELHKFNLSHDHIHQIAVMIVNDILPGMRALAEQTNKALNKTT